MHWTEMAENETAPFVPCRLRFEDEVEHLWSNLSPPRMMHDARVRITP